MKLPIITHPNPDILEVPCTDISRDVLLSKDIQSFIKNLQETMHEAKGIGIAAPQVGKLIRMCVINKEAFTKKIKTSKGEINLDDDLILINPTWEKTSRRTEWDTEGCLSIPKIYGKVKRNKHIFVSALDAQGNELAFDASNFFARVIQHEIDHLQGVLFISKGKDIYEVE